MGVYTSEQFTDEEAAVLRPYFTNLDQPVFALVNLPEVVKGALFARYSRTHKSLRRLFLDEFVADLDLTGDLTVDATIGLRRAEELYDRVFLEYGDDSVAQLGGVHLACEQASNLLTKILEWGRLMAYLEQSTRYIPYDTKLGGRYRYYRPPRGAARRELGARYVADMDALFDTYAEMLPQLIDWARERYPKEPGDSDFVYKQTIKAKACDAARGILPAATLSNVGIYGTGQAFEALLLRMRAHPLPEARSYAAMMLEELRKVIPSFLARVDRADRGRGVERVPRGDPRTTTAELVAPHVRRRRGRAPPERHAHRLRSRRRGQAARCDLLPADAPSRGPGAGQVRTPRPTDERVALLQAYVGERRNRRHRPGRAFERVDYRFDVARRLRRVPRPAASPHAHHRVATAVDRARLRDPRAGRRSRADRAVRGRDGALGRAHDALADPLPRAGRLRGVARVPGAVRDADERTRGDAPPRAAHRPSGHPSYRRIAQEMHRLIAEQAGHRAIAAAMSYVDHTTYELERLAAERAAEARRTRARVTKVCQPRRRRDTLPRSVTGACPGGGRRRNSRRLTSVDRVGAGHSVARFRLTRPLVRRTTRRPDHRGHPSGMDSGRGGAGGSGDQVENAGITRLHGQAGPNSGPNGLLGSPSSRPRSSILATYTRE